MTHNILAHNILAHNILVLGSGAREHALIEHVRKSSFINMIHVYPGNDGMKRDKVQIINIFKTIEVEQFNQYIVTYCKSNDIEMVIVGSEQYLVNGISDILNDYKIKCFGPSQKASQIEGSKIFSKDFYEQT